MNSMQGQDLIISALRVFKVTLPSLATEMAPSTPSDPNVILGDGHIIVKMIDGSALKIEVTEIPKCEYTMSHTQAVCGNPTCRVR